MRCHALRMRSRRCSGVSRPRYRPRTCARDPRAVHFRARALAPMRAAAFVAGSTRCVGSPASRTTASPCSFITAGLSPEATQITRRSRTGHSPTKVAEKLETRSARYPNFVDPADLTANTQPLTPEHSKLIAHQLLARKAHHEQPDSRSPSLARGSRSPHPQAFSSRTLSRSLPR
jgi:hypothetical protein